MPTLHPADSVATHPQSLIIPANKLLLALPLEDFQRIVLDLTIVPLVVKAVLHKQGEKIRHIYFPGGGACSLIKTMQDGGTAEIATAGNEGMIGACVFFGEDQSIGETLVQVGEAYAFRMPVDAFREEMERHGRFYNLITRYTQALSAQIMQTAVCNALHSVQERCCRWLLMTRDRVGANELKVTHDFLAIMLGVRRPTVTLVMGDLEKADMVANRRGSITILDPQRLDAAACECYASVKAHYHRLLPEIPGSTG
jgi:CRP-like cAMP-binding protein